MADGRRYGRRYALMVIDLDGFKRRQRPGRACGRRCPAARAWRRAAQVVRGGDVIARLGGDEFVLLMEFQSWPEEPATVAARVKGTLDAARGGGGWHHGGDAEHWHRGFFPKTATTPARCSPMPIWRCTRPNGATASVRSASSTVPIAQAVRQREVLLEEVEQALNDGRFGSALSADRRAAGWP